MVGPDHYLPLAAVARERRWGLGRTCAVTASFGLLHCLTSVVVVFALAVAATRLDLMASAGAWLMIGTGGCLALHALRRRQAERSKAVPVLLGLAFLIGPCEWLIPVAGATMAEFGSMAAVAVCVAFSLATIGTMLGAVAVATRGFRWIPQRHSALIGGLVCAGCGVLMLVGF